MVSHHPFAGKRNALEHNDDIVNDSVVFEKLETRMKVADTEEGQELQQRVDDLLMLLAAYRSGAVREGHN